MADPSESPQPLLLSPVSATPAFSTRQVFRRGAERLVRVMEGFDADSLNTHNHTLCNWSIESGWDGDIYLVHPTVVRRSSSRASQHGAGEAAHLEAVPEDENDFTEEEILWSDESVINDSDVVMNGLLDEEIESSDSESEWNFSIVYSETWRVPVLYFHVQQRDGTPCTRNYVLEVLQGDSHSHQNKVADSWDFVSHEEHPVSRCPSFFLHPCRTRERLETLQANSNISSDEALRLLSWMSMIFPSVGCSISSRTFQQLRDRLLLDLYR
jgi:hypothetical protein